MKTIIYGSGSTARLIARFAPYIAGVVEDFPSRQTVGSPLASLPVCRAEDMRTVYPAEDYELLIGIGYQHGGMNAKRAELANMGYSLGSAFFGLGYRENVSGGCIVLPGTVLHDNCSIGRNCFVASNVTVGHDVMIGSHSWINSGVALDGWVKVGGRCVIGANAVIKDGVTLGERTLVGPGAVVLRDTAPGSVVLAPESVVHRFSSDVFGSLP